MAKKIFIIILVYSFFGCGTVDNNKNEPEEISQLEVLINGIGWADYYKNDKVVKFRSSGIIQDGINWGNAEEMSLSVGWRIDYESYYWENLSVEFIVPSNFNLDEFKDMEVDFRQIDHPLAGIRFSEFDYDVGVGEFNRYDTTEVAMARITYFNYEEKIVEVVFEGKLILDEHQMARPDHSEWHRRPDTLHITNGRIRTLFKDFRPQPDDSTSSP